MRSNYLVALATLGLSGCITAHVEDARETTTGIKSGESIVIMAHVKSGCASLSGDAHRSQSPAMPNG